VKILEKKVVWITGATSGIGRATALLFAKQGARLIISGRNENELEILKSQIQKIGADVEYLAFDLFDTEKLPSIAQKAIDIFGVLHILFNNGGVSQRSLAHETPIEIDRKIMEIDYFSNVILTKSVLPHMLKNKEGHILVTSSIAGVFGFRLRSSYSAAKHAIYGFYESLRIELLDKNIKVTIVTPGRVRTNISKNALTSDGSTHNEMDAGQANGISAEKCAEDILNAIKKNKIEVLSGGGELKAVYIRRLFPKLFYKIVPKFKEK
jgi:dehydrogenase/reductase SDR family member 7B